MIIMNFATKNLVFHHHIPRVRHLNKKPKNSICQSFLGVGMVVFCQFITLYTFHTLHREGWVAKGNLATVTKSADFFKHSLIAICFLFYKSQPWRCSVNSPIKSILVSMLYNHRIAFNGYSGPFL